MHRKESHLRKLFLSLPGAIMLAGSSFAFSADVDVGEAMDQMKHDYDVAMKTNDPGAFLSLL